MFTVPPLILSSLSALIASSPEFRLRFPPEIFIL